MKLTRTRFYRSLLAALLGLASAAVSGGDLDPTKVTALHKAVRLNQINEVKQFAVSGVVYLNASNVDGITPLQEAIRYGYREMYLFLIHSGIDVDARDADQRAALHYAAESNEPEAVEALIKALADLDAVDDYNYVPLHLAAREGNLPIVRMLIGAGAELNSQIDVGFTAIDLAEQHPDVQDYLRIQGGKTMVELATAK